MEAAELLPILQGRSACVPGGRDYEGRSLVVIPVPTETQPWSKEHLEDTLRYFQAIYSPDTRRNGLAVIVDAQRGAWRLARACIRQVMATLASDAPSILVLRPDAFWDKQRVDNCARTHRDGEPIYISISRITKYVDWSQLPEELGGTWPYNHTQWIQNRIFVESFFKDAEVSLTELERLRQRLSSFKSRVRVSSVEEALTINTAVFQGTTELAHKVLQAGPELMTHLESQHTENHRRFGRSEVATPQDVVDTRARVERLLEIIRGKMELVDEARGEMERCLKDVREINILEDGVSQVTNWILGPAEMLLNRQREVGFDVLSAEELRQEHESLELQCRETYGHYAELLHKIDTIPQVNVSLPEDLKSQRDFMDFVCRSFATRLERRRNVLITSLRFYRLVGEYFEETSVVFESMLKYSPVEDLDTASSTLKDLEEDQGNIDLLEQEVLKEGEKLADILSMPVKDALGRDVQVNYEADILNVHELLNAVCSRRKLFRDSVSLRRLTLEQVCHVAQYERDAAQAVQWLRELLEVLLREHGHVGCGVLEIQTQKDDHQSFHETAKSTYEYGCQLLSAALSLRQSCKLPVDVNTSLSQELWQSWKKLQTVCQEQLTRLRVSAVFHRSVQEHCCQLRELMEAVKAMAASDDSTRRRSRLHRFLTARERLLLEVGRMVRLGRLLRTRLREPLCAEHESSGGGVSEDAGGGRDEPHGNTTVVEAISERLADVTSLAEQLDAALCGLQRSDAAPDMKRILDGTASTTPEDWYSSLKKGSGSGVKQQAVAATSSTASTSNGSIGGGEDGGRTSDDEFVTASECTCTPPSRSSSYHTASEGGGASPWWEVDPPGDSGQGALVKTTTEIRTGVLIHEVTETTKVRLSHSDTLGVTSYVITSETVRTGNPEDLTRTVEETLDVGPVGDVRTRASTEVSKDTPKDAEGPGSSSDKAESSSDPEVLEPTQEEGLADPVLSQMKEVRGVEYDQHSPGGEPRYYYHQHIARHAVKGIL